MKYSKRIAILLALLLIAGLFAACGGEKDQETQPALTLPDIDAPASIGQDNGPRTENEKGDGGIIDDDGQEPLPAGQTENPNNAPFATISTEFTGSDTEALKTWPDSDTPAPTYPKPSDPGTTEGVPSYDDSDEDLPAITTEYPDDTDEDLG